MELDTEKVVRLTLATLVLTGAHVLLTDKWADLSNQVSAGDLSAEDAVREYDNFMLPAVVLSGKMLIQDPDMIEKATESAEKNYASIMKNIDSEMFDLMMKGTSL